MNAPDEAFRARWDEAAGVVRVEWIPGAELTLASAELITTISQGFSPDPPLLLVDVRGLTGKLDKAGRKHLVDELDKLTRPSSTRPTRRSTKQNARAATGCCGPGRSP